MLRITEKAQSSSCTNLKVEGRIVSSWVGLLENKCRKLLQNQSTVVLDFSEVTFIDAQGLAMLKRLASPQLLLVNSPPFIEELYETEGALWQGSKT